MNNVKCQTTSNQLLTTPSEVDQISTVYQVYVTISHEWGDIVLAETLATRVSTANYSYTMTVNDTKSAGIHKIHWRYIISGVTYTKDVYVNIYQPYMLASDFFNNNPDLEDDFSDSFDVTERKVRDIINTFCGQTFDPYFQKTISVDGTDRNTLYMPMRLQKVTSITLLEAPQENDPFNEVDDYTTSIGLVPQSNYFLRFLDRTTTFGDEATFTIFGDWGWPWVPTNISEASELLIVDHFNDDSTIRQHGITEVKYDTRSGYVFSDTIFESTGNTDADVLLLDYTMFLIEMI